MPAQVYPLGEWKPDIPGGLSVAENVYPIANGYAPVGGLQKVANALPAAFAGGGSFVDSAGNSHLMVGTPTELYEYSGTAWASRAGSISGTSRWHIAQYGDEVLIASGDKVVGYNLVSTTSGYATDAPYAVDIAQTRDFVMAITTDNALQWCQFNNPIVWTTGTNQADKQPSLWGRLKRIVGGEYMVAITDRSVVRGTYVGVEGGLDIIWQFDEISQEVGCMAEGSVCNVGRLIFFLSERGFQMCDGNEVVPIADEKINRWFFSTYSRSDIANIWSAVDPRNSVAMWGMPGSPGRILAYNWVLKRWSSFRLPITGLLSGYTAAISLDALDAIYGNLDAIPISLDDPSLQGGNPILLVADGSNVINALSGPSLQATLELENVEPAPGKRSRIRELRLVSDTTSASATIDARMRAGDTESIRTAATMRSNGKLPIRSNGRYNNISVTIPAATNWSFIQAVEVEFEAGDAR